MIINIHHAVINDVIIITQPFNCYFLLYMLIDTVIFIDFVNVYVIIVTVMMSFIIVAILIVSGCCRY